MRREVTGETSLRLRGDLGDFVPTFWRHDGECHCGMTTVKEVGVAGQVVEACGPSVQALAARRGCMGDSSRRHDASTCNPPTRHLHHCSCSYLDPGHFHTAKPKTSRLFLNASHTSSTPETRRPDARLHNTAAIELGELQRTPSRASHTQPIRWHQGRRSSLR